MYASKLPATGRMAILALTLSVAAHASAASPAPAPRAAEAPWRLPPKLASEVDRYMRAAVQFDQFSGTILIAKDGAPVVSQGYGMANEELKVRNSPRTVFRLGSLTKQFTALALLQLQERGKLSVKDPLCRYLDRCPAAWQPITIHHLLTHTSGIPNYSSLPHWDETLSLRPYDRLGFVDVFRDLPLQFTPGEKFRYSNSGYYLLGLVIERASGTTYADFLRANIFEPLKMASSGYDDGRSLVPNRADGYAWSQNAFVNAKQVNMALPYAAGSLYSTTQDLLLWDRALRTEQLVSRSSLDQLFTPGLNGYAYGWHVGEKFARKTQGHGGSIHGFSSYLLRFPAERVIIIVLSNSQRTSATKVANNLAAIAFGEPYTLPKPQLFDVLSAAVAREGVARAIETYRTLRRDRPKDFDFAESVLNDLGYELLGANKVTDAIELFRLNVEMWPGSANVHDSLGEAYLRSGNPRLARESYARSLELDPENQNAARVLASLRADALD